MAENWQPLEGGAQGGVYGLIRISLRAAQWVVCSAKLEGTDQVPRSGGVLLVSNHVSNADPLLLTALSPRPVVFMAKVELFRPWIARWAARRTHAAFPVRRGASDVRAVREALARVRGGAALAIYPEGTRQAHGLGPALPGASYLATRAGCPVVPVAMVGTEQLNTPALHRPAIQIRFGAPFDIERDAPAGEVMHEIMRRIAELLPPDRRGAYAASERVADAS